MRVRRQLAALALVLLASFSCRQQDSTPAAAPAPSVTAEQAAADKAAGSYRFERNGWIFVHLEGSPSQVGYQHGYRLAPEIADLLRVTKPFLLETTKKDWAFYRDVAEEIL